MSLPHRKSVISVQIYIRVDSVWLQCMVWDVFAIQEGVISVQIYIHVDSVWLQCMVWDVFATQEECYFGTNTHTCGQCVAAVYGVGYLRVKQMLYCLLLCKESNSDSVLKHACIDLDRLVVKVSVLYVRDLELKSWLSHTNDLTQFIPSNFRGINLSGPSNFQFWGRKTGAPTK